MEADKFETRTDSSLVTNMVCNTKHDAMRQTKLVVYVESALDISKLLRPLHEVNELIVITLSTEIDQVSFFHSAAHLLAHTLGNCSLLLNAQYGSRLVLH